jgi:hypothetical protein
VLHQTAIIDFATHAIFFYRERFLRRERNAATERFGTKHDFDRAIGELRRDTGFGFVFAKGELTLAFLAVDRPDRFGITRDRRCRNQRIRPLPALQ